MSDSENAGFGKFVPGFDFLQSLAKGATQAVPQMPNISSWIAPSLNEEELDKRIAELKAVHFWLDQNAKALGATVQALEVQKLTLATLKGMNLNIGDLASAFKFKAPEPAEPSAPAVAEKEAPTPKPQLDAAAPAEPAADQAAPAAAAPGLVDPMQLWTSLTQQFQHIAAGAMKEASKVAALDLGKSLVEGMSAETKKAGKSVGTSAPAKKAPAKKTAAKKAPVKKAATGARGR